MQQGCLLGHDPQPEGCQSLVHFLAKSLGIFAVLEHGYKVVGESRELCVATARLPEPPFEPQVEDVVQIGSKDGALRHHCRTFPSSALRTGRATHRCTQLASNVISLLPEMFKLTQEVTPEVYHLRTPRHLNDAACGPSPCARCDRLPGGALLPRLLWPLCTGCSRSPSKPVILSMRIIGQEESRQVPGSYEGTLTSEGRLPSAFPRMRA